MTSNTATRHGSKAKRPTAPMTCTFIRRSRGRFGSPLAIGSLSATKASVAWRIFVGLASDLNRNRTTWRTAPAGVVAVTGRAAGTVLQATGVSAKQQVIRNVRIVRRERRCVIVRDGQEQIVF